MLAQWDRGLTPAQRGMVFDELVAPRGGRGTTQIVLAPGSSFDANAFVQAWRLVVDAHPVLRSRVVEGTSGEYRLQTVGRVEPDYLDSELQGPDGAKELERWLAEDRAGGMDLFSRVPMRLTFLRHPEGPWLVWTFHSLLLDRESVAAVLADVSHACDALRSGRPSEVPARNGLVAGFDRTDAHESGAAAHYWNDLLAGIDGPTPFPAMESRNPVRQRTIERRLGAGFAERLDGWLEANQFTFSSLVQAAWATLLARHVDAVTVAFGATLENRVRPEQDAGRELCAPSGVVPVRAEVDLITGIELVRALCGQETLSHSHGHAPLAQLSGETAGEPLFHTLVAAHDETFDLLVQRHLTTTHESRYALHHCPPYPVVLFAFMKPDCLLRLVHEEGALGDAQAARIIEHLLLILRGIVEHPGCQVRRLPMLTRGELELIDRCNETRREFEPVTIHQAFALAVARHPDGPALTGAGRTLSFAQLDRASSAVALGLAKRGLHPGSLVAISMDRSLEMVVGMLGILKSGSAYLPLDPAYPAERIDFCLRDSGAQWILTQQRHAGRFGSSGAEVLDIETVLSGTSIPAQATFTQERGSASDLAYMIYTSGSTGRPKGVLVTHANVANFFRGMDEVVERSETYPQRWLAVTSPSFDISVTELLWTLTRGFETVVHRARTLSQPVRSAGPTLSDADSLSSAPISEGLDEPDLVEDIARHGITHLQCTPSMAGTIPTMTQNRADLASLRQVLIGGEALALDLVDSLHQHLPETTRIVNMYGPTETTVWSTTQPLSRAPEKVTIGRPIANTQCYVLDSFLQLAPPGSAGQLHLAGAGVARGYHRRPELEAERFFDLPMGGAGRRVYATGDLVRQQEDGQLEYLGRNDFQVKIRGHRIEPGEVEIALRAQAGVSDAVVLPRADGAGAQALVGYVVAAAPGTAGAASALKASLRRLLPEYMVPDRFVWLDALPLTPNGKVDRHALPAPCPGPVDVSRAAALDGEAEQVVGDIWKRVLALPQVGRHENFFEIGGHSILAIKVQSELAQAFGIRLPIFELFRSPTVAALAARFAARDVTRPVAAASAGAAKAGRRRAAMSQRLAAVGRSHESR
ncbi:MAG: AMP-binding protein [Pseudomonadota bacterium]|nr:AMP-binding protein [Pseudomonadota bacterium]